MDPKDTKLFITTNQRTFLASIHVCTCIHVWKCVDVNFVETFESLAVIKSTMKAKNWTASTMTTLSVIIPKLPVTPAVKKVKAQAKREKRLSEAARVQSSKMANKLVQRGHRLK